MVHGNQLLIYTDTQTRFPTQHTFLQNERRGLSSRVACPDGPCKLEDPPCAGPVLRVKPIVRQ